MKDEERKRKGVIGKEVEKIDKKLTFAHDKVSAL
jgi:hypothetical protein